MSVRAMDMDGLLKLGSKIYFQSDPQNPDKVLKINLNPHNNNNNSDNNNQNDSNKSIINNNNSSSNSSSSSSSSSNNNNNNEIKYSENSLMSFAKYLNRPQSLTDRTSHYTEKDIDYISKEIHNLLRTQKQLTHAHSVAKILHGISTPTNEVHTYIYTYIPNKQTDKQTN